MDPIEPTPVTPEVPFGPTPRRRGGWRVVRTFWEWTKSMAAAILLFVVVRSFLVEAFKIPSGSMEGTLLVGDFLLVNKAVYGADVPFTSRRTPRLRAPQHGDVVVFEFPLDPTIDFVKRFVGLPGDTLSMTDGQLFRNGQPVKEPYVSHTDPGTDPVGEEFGWQREFLVKRAAAARPYRPSRNNWGPIVVPAGNYFALGDNRDNSYDSRYWGFVPDSMIRGEPLFVYYSYIPDSSTAAPFVTHVRWGRLGSRVR